MLNRLYYHLKKSQLILLLLLIWIAWTSAFAEGDPFEGEAVENSAVDADLDWDADPDPEWDREREGEAERNVSCQPESVQEHQEPLSIATDQSDPGYRYRLAVGHSKKEAAALYEQGVEQIRKRNWLEVLQIFFALQQSPFYKTWDKRIKLALASAYLELDQDQLAAQLLPETIGAFSAINDDLRWMLAEAHFKTGQYDQARRQYRRLRWIRAGSSPETIRRKLERTHFFDAQLGEVACLLEEGEAGKAARLTLHFEREYSSYAQTLPGFELDDPPSHPRQNDLYWLRARAYRALKQTEKERLLLRRMQPFDPSCRYCGVAEERRKQLNEEIAQPPVAYGTALLREVSRLKTERRDEQRLALIEQHLKEHPPGSDGFDRTVNAKLLYEQGQTLSYLTRYSEALQVFQDLYYTESGLQSEKDQYLYMISKTLGRQNQLQRAVDTYLEMADSFPKSGLAKMARFMAAWLTGNRSGRYEDADRLLQDFQQRYRRDSLARKALWFRGWFAYRAGKFDIALSRFKDLLDNYPRSSYASACRYWIGRIYEQRHDYTRAKSYFVYLAGDERRHYYRLAAQARLNSFLVIDETHAVVGELDPLHLDPIQEATVDDPDVMLVLRERKRNWRDAVDILRQSPLFTSQLFHHSMMERFQTEAIGFVATRSSRHSRLRKWVKPYAALFPKLKQAVVWQELGYYERASAALRGFVERWIELQSRTNETPYKDETPAEAALRMERLQALQQVPKRFAFDILACFLEYQDISGAFRVFTAGLTRADRKQIPQPFRTMLTYPPAFADTIGRFSEESNVREDLLLSIMRTESYFKPHAVSRVNALGLMQIMPATGAKIADSNGEASHSHSLLYKPETSIRFGAWYLSELKKKFQGQWPLAIAAYNGGPHNVEIWLQRHPELEWDEFIESIEFLETRNYVKKVLTIMATYRAVYLDTFASWDFMQPISYEVGDNIDF